MTKHILLVLVVVSLLLAACSPAPPSAPTPAAPMVTTPAVEAAGVPAGETSLTTQPWQWIAFSGGQEPFTVETPGSYQVTFNEDGTVTIVADCSNAAGTYTAEMASSVKMPSLTIALGPMTTAACPDGSRSEQFVQLLSRAAAYFTVDDELYINLKDDAGIMRLGPAGETVVSPEAEAEAAQVAAMVAGIKANPWKWTNYSSTIENVAVETPASYLVTFKDDGTLDIKADCNDASGTYTLDGANVTIEVDAATLMACPGDSRSEQFLQLLGDAAQLVPLNSQLFVSLKTEGSTMILDAAPTTVVDLCGEEALAIDSIEDTLAPEISAQLDQALVSLVQAAPRPGPAASMLIITAQGRYHKSTGVADVTTCKPLAADSPYQIGSNTKMMTSAILFQLQEEGKLSTSDPLSKWLPELAAQLPNGDQITLDMMLTHTSGLADYFDVPTRGGSIADGAKDKAMLTRAFTPEELVKLVAQSGLSEFAPGTAGQWKYSNTGYILLGLIIEKATGRSYEQNLMPLYLKSLVEGGAEAVAGFLGAQKGTELLASRTASLGSYALLMHMAMVCSDDPAKSVDEVKLDGAGRYATLFGQSGAEQYVQLCSLIDVQELPDSTDVDVTTDVPVLLPSGNLDVQPPTFRTQEVADALPNATLLVFPGRTHVQLAGSNLCAGQIMTQFVLDPTAKLDTICLKDAPVVGFALPDGTSSKE